MMYVVLTNNAFQGLDTVIKTANLEVLPGLVRPQIADALLVLCNARFQRILAVWSSRNPVTVT